MKILAVSSPITGHFNPLLVAAKILKNAGHDVSCYTSRLFREKVEAVGLRFFPLPVDVDHDMRDINAAFPERQTHVPGPAQLLFDMKTIFADAIPSQFKGLKAILEDVPVDLVLYEQGFAGVLPLLLNSRSPRPAVAGLGIGHLSLKREDGGTPGLGLPPAKDQAQREEYRAIAHQVDASLLNPVRAYVDRHLHKLGAASLPGSLFESMALLPDVYLQPCVPSLVYPLREPVSNLRFIGALFPEGSGDVPPAAKAAKEAGRRVVLASQGTLANQDMGLLAAPAIQALGNRDDLFILVTTGGRPVDSIPVALSKNSIVSPFLNFREVLPYVDVMVAFGGYGTVTQALSLGVPMVLAGLGEDKPENGGQVASSGSGIYLRTDTPTVEQVRDSVGQILSEPSYHANAKRLAAEFAHYDSAKELPRLLETVVAERASAAGHEEKTNASQRG
jgi:UDP:flavonoid glycosyltransferase YjiC (YdhE family)